MAYNFRGVEIRRLAIILPLTSSNTQHTCLDCKFFQSWADYNEDEKDDLDYGLYEFQVCASVGRSNICDKHIIEQE